MSTTQPPSEPQPTDPSAIGATPGEPPEGKRRNWWIWVSAGLAVVILGLVVWQFQTQSELDSAQADVADLQAQIEEGQKSGGEAAEAYSAAYQDLEAELGTTQEDLAATQQDLEQAQQAAEDAAQDAATAKQQVQDADNAIDQAAAEAEAAKADAQVAEANLTTAAECANTFIAQLGTVMQSADPTAAAATAKAELEGIADDCRTALGR